MFLFVFTFFEIFFLCLFFSFSSFFSRPFDVFNFFQTRKPPRSTVHQKNPHPATGPCRLLRGTPSAHAIGGQRIDDGPSRQANEPRSRFERSSSAKQPLRWSSAGWVQKTPGLEREAQKGAELLGFPCLSHRFSYLEPPRVFMPYEDFEVLQKPSHLRHVPAMTEKLLRRRCLLTFEGASISLSPPRRTRAKDQSRKQPTKIFTFFLHLASPENLLLPQKRPRSGTYGRIFSGSFS